MGVIWFIVTIVSAGICVECHSRIEIAERFRHLHHSAEVDRKIRRYTLIANFTSALAIGFGAMLTAHLLVALANALFT